MDSRRWPYYSHAPPWDDSDNWVIAGEPGEPYEPSPQPEPGPEEPARDDRRYDPPYGGAQPYDGAPHGGDPYGGQTYGGQTYGGRPYGGTPQPYGGPQPYRDERYGAPPPPPYRGEPWPEPAEPPSMPWEQPPARRSGPDRAAPEPVARFEDFDEIEEPAAEPDPPPWPAVLAWTLCYFLVPVLLYLGWAFTRSGDVLPECVDETGAPCMSPRGDAIAALVNVGPALVGALALAIVASVVMRRLTATWRPGTVGFAAAVVGAATATVVAGVLR